MLTDIHIHHFTLIDQLELTLQPGMTVLTGETGAGKSIIIEAVSMALGERASSHAVSPTSEKAEIHLHFDLSQIPEACNWLREHDMDNESECFIRRVIHKDGRSKSYINQIPVTLPLLKELAEHLINIHGQHAFQNLLKADHQRNLLDHYAEHHDTLTEVNQLFHAWQHLQNQYEQLQNQQASRLQRADYLRFQLDELDALDLTLDELHALEAEHKQLANIDELLKQGNQALSLLQEQDTAIIDQLHFAIQSLDSIQQLHPHLQSAHQLLNQALVNAEESVSALKHYVNRLESDPARLQMIEDRLAKAHDLARKHRTTLDALPALQKTMRDEFDSVANIDEELQTLKNQLHTLEQQYTHAAKRLSKSRDAAAKKLSTQITHNIQQLAMPNGQLIIELVAYQDALPRAHGMEKIQFLVNTNPGQPLQPLQSVVSGGELSRISLAIQVITAEQSATPTLIFDEVDVGIGGATAGIVGALLRKLGGKTQVLCITHLAQVAAQGHQHIKVEKHQEAKTTKTKLVYLARQERILEIARMSGGVEINQKTLEHAETLLPLAK